jgi:hypothetical protein
LKCGAAEGRRRSAEQMCERNEEVLHTDREKRDILYVINRRDASWIGHILRRNSFLKHVIEGEIEGKM